MATDRKPVGSIAIASGGALALAISLIAGWEGKSNDPYKDIVGVQTVCYGQTNIKMRHYSDKECSDMLAKAAGSYQEGVLKITPGLKDHPKTLAAATSLAYNIGLNAYKTSTVAARFNQGNLAGGCNAFSMWRMAGGKVSQGLVNRRKAEIKLCLQF